MGVMFIKLKIPINGRMNLRLNRKYIIVKMKIIKLPVFKNPIYLNAHDSIYFPFQKLIKTVHILPLLFFFLSESICHLQGLFIFFNLKQRCDFISFIHYLLFESRFTLPFTFFILTRKLPQELVVDFNKSGIVGNVLP